eukprot:gene1074-642_t
MMRELREHFHREPYTWARSTDHRKRAALWDEGRFQDYLAHYLLIAHLSCFREMHASAGRMDVQIWTATYEYILELKVRESGGKRDSALEQTKKYAAERTSLGKPKIFVGIVFSKWLKNISDWISEGPGSRIESMEKKQVNASKTLIEQRIQSSTKKKKKKKRIDPNKRKSLGEKSRTELEPPPLRKPHSPL